MDSMESKTVADTWLRIQLRFGMIDKVGKAKGTKNFKIKRLIDATDGLLEMKEMKDQPVDAQYRNYR